MRRPTARLSLSASYNEKKAALDLRLRPNVNAIHDLAALLGDQLEKHSTLWLMNSLEAQQPEYSLRRGERETVRVITDTIEDERLLLGAVALAFHARVESQRIAKHEEHYRFAGSMAVVGALSGALSPDRWIAGISWATGAAGGVAAGYLHAHPPAPQEMLKLPDGLDVPIRVLRPVGE